MNITWIGAHPNNYMVGRNGQTVQGLVLHWIVGTLESADKTFQNPDRIASATYGVGGRAVHQYVREEDTAYGNGNWNSNLTTISIEHEGGPNLPISEETYQTSIKLVAELCQKYSIPLDRQHIKGHKEVSNTPTTCPGTLGIDRIIRDSAIIAQPIAQTDQTIIDLGQYGKHEVQAIRGFYGDALNWQKDLENTRKENKLLTQTNLTLTARIRELESQTPPTPPNSPLYTWSGLLDYLRHLLNSG